MGRMQITFSDDGRDFTRRDWSALVDADPTGTFFHYPAYLKLYWEEFGAAPEHLLLAFADDASGGLVGAVAFERIGGSLRFLGGTEVTDYMSPVALPGWGDAMAKELLAGLVRRNDWGEADLRGLPEDSPWLERLRAGAEDQGVTAEIVEDSNGVAPHIALPGSWDDYLSRLPSKLRHEIRRKARRLESEVGEYRVVISTEETISGDLDRFVELHRSSEGPKGVFMKPGMEIFFRRLGEAFLPKRVFRLASLEVQGVKVAGTIGFSCNGTYYLYNSAFDHSWERLAPGMVLVAEVIREAIGERCGRFDMLKGDYPYKYRFGALQRRIKRLVLRR
jgi:CelD/BcsL family acetyltransferase involved in cellulose biosynthesis